MAAGDSSMWADTSDGEPRNGEPNSRTVVSLRQELEHTKQDLDEMLLRLRGARSEVLDLERKLASKKRDVLRGRQRTLKARGRSRKISERLVEAEIRADLANARCALERNRTVELAAAFRGLPGLKSRFKQMISNRSLANIRGQEIDAFISDFEHELLRSVLRSSGFFDRQYYETRYPEAVAHPQGSLEHFVMDGRFRGYSPNEIFEPATYLELNPDVADSGGEPSEHYALDGFFEMRPTGDQFDAIHYFGQMPELAAAGVNPIAHFLQQGRSEGLTPVPEPEEENQGIDPDHGGPRVDVDYEADERELARLRSHYESHAAEIDATLVSIVMPTFNRAQTLHRAIDSVLRQSHNNWELLIIDDGSTDETQALLADYSHDDRLQLRFNDHRGVSGARNDGLDMARGEYVAYLDSDNEWTPEFLRSMVSHLHETGSPCGYAAMVFNDERGDPQSYLSSEFDWEKCREANYVDMNVFVHRRDLGTTQFRFETRLRRMVDWDYILRLTREHPATHTPFIGCHYFDGTGTGDRISRSEPMIWGQIVQRRNDPAFPEPVSFAALSKEIVLDFAIRISAPWTKRNVWGDHHYAVELKDALQRLGHQARIVYSDHEEDDGDVYRGEVDIVLRGLSAYGPQQSALNILWVISHPEAVGSQEMAGYNIVYLASQGHAALVSHDKKLNPKVLLQASAFQPPTPEVAESPSGVLFVGNSRKVDRPVVRWAAEKGLDLAVFGGDWQGTSVEAHVRATSISNDSLPELYSNAEVVLNDHWQSMLDFGYVSNRLFDVLASGGRVISDAMPAIGRLFGPAVSEVRNADEILDVIAGDELHDAIRDQVAEAVRSEHDFDQRAKEIVNDVYEFLSLDAPHGKEIGGQSPDMPTSIGGPHAANLQNRLNVGTFFMSENIGFSSSAYIRLLAPLTTEEVFDRVALSSYGEAEELPFRDLDHLIVQRAALPSLDETRKLLAETRANDVKLLVDLDDSFEHIAKGSRLEAVYKPRLAALKMLVEEADAIVVSTSGIAHAYGIDGDPRCHIVRNTLDPRYWRRYPRALPTRPDDQPISVLYMGTATHDEDFDLVVDALDEWQEIEPFELTIVGAVRRPPQRDWITTLPPPRDAGLYPRFAHWLAGLPQFDIGIAPLCDTAFNAAKSDIKFLDYCAIGAVPVVSDCAAYRADADAQDFMYHASDTASWVRALTSAASEVRSGARTAERREYLWKHRNAATAAHELLEVMRSLSSDD